MVTVCYFLRGKFGRFFAKTSIIRCSFDFFQLRGFMNEVLLDQIPSLIDLQRYLEQLSIMEPPAMKKDIILEQVYDFKCLFKSLYRFVFFDQLLQLFLSA